MEKARELFQKIFKYLSRPEMRILPGHLAFFLVMSIIPTIALVGVITNSLNIPMDAVKLTISSSIPKDIADVLTDLLGGQGFNFNIAVFFISAFLFAPPVAIIAPLFLTVIKGFFRLFRNISIGLCWILNIRGI